MVTEVRTVVTFGSRVISGGRGTREGSGMLDYVQYLICGGSYRGVYLCKNSSLKIVLYISIYTVYKSHCKISIHNTTA